jgi:hypothetical protein
LPTWARPTAFVLSTVPSVAGVVVTVASLHDPVTAWAAIVAEAELLYFTRYRRRRASRTRAVLGIAARSNLNRPVYPPPSLIQRLLPIGFP